VEQANEQLVDDLLALARATPVTVPPVLMARVEADALRWLPPAPVLRPVRQRVGWRAWWARATSLPRAMWPTALASATACVVLALAWSEPVQDERVAWQEFEAWAWEAEVHDAWVAWESSL
jgi:hypothetical protein